MPFTDAFMLILRTSGLVATELMIMFGRGVLTNARKVRLFDRALDASTMEGAHLVVLHTRYTYWMQAAGVVKGSETDIDWQLRIASSRMTRAQAITYAFGSSIPWSPSKEALALWST